MTKGNNEEGVYKFIKGYIESNHEAPTIMEIGRQSNLSSSSVHAILKKLESKGLITRTPNISRGISLAQ